MTHLSLNGKLATQLRICACALIVLAASPDGRSFEGLGSVRISASQRSWTIEADSSGAKTTISQWLTPFTATLPMNDYADLVLSSAGASTVYDSKRSSTSRLDGLSDLKAQLFLRLYDAHLLIHAGANLPTGQAEVRVDQLDLAQLLGHPLLGFRVKEYGRGFDLSAGAACAADLGEHAILGIGAGVIHHGPYTIVAGLGDYQPGQEVSFSSGLDLNWTRGEGTRLRFDATYRLYERDELGTVPIFEEGNQLELQSTATTSQSTWQAHVLGRLVVKEDNNQYWNDGEDSALRKLDSSAGTQMMLVVSAAWHVVGKLHAGLAVESNHFRNSDVPLINGDAYAFGPRADLALGDNARLSLVAQYMRGAFSDTGAVPGADLDGYHVVLAFHRRVRR